MNATICEKCGAPLAASSVGPICPRCLLGEYGAAPAARVTPEGVLPRWFGEYELLEELGRGGMGVVYRARQPNLDRTVALKMPVGVAAADHELCRRFRTEAAAAARLRHPCIVTIHDCGETDGQVFYVMDFIAGRNLEQICAGRPLAARRVATLLRQLAQAVHYAHVAGVVHRDLKPSNVLIDAADMPHITDFGLARLLERCDGVTVAGQVLGSPGYAAPEQLEGRGHDATVAGDIYSLGALGYHLATGRAPFVGQSAADTLRLMLEGRLVAPRTLNPELPRALEAILLQCLAREPAERYPSAAALATDLERFLDACPVEAAGAWRTSGRRRWAWAAGIGAAAMVAVLGGAVWWRGHSGAVVSGGTLGPVVHATIELPAEAPLAPARNTPLAVPALPLTISGDGAYVAYVAQMGETRQLCLRALDESRVRPLPGTEGAYGPTFSPDGRSIAFLTDSRIKRTSVDGGDVVSLCEVSDDTYGLVWANDGFIYLSEGGSLSRVPETGGAAEPVPSLSRARAITSADWGDGFIFRRPDERVGGSSDYCGLWRFDFATGQTRDLRVTGHSARLVTEDSLVFARGDGLFAVALDRGAATGRGAPVKLLSGLQIDGNDGLAQYAVSQSGTLVYAEGGDVGAATPAWVDRQGKVSRLPVPPKNCGMFELSPDGRWLALVVHDAQSEILLIDVETGMPRRFGPAGFIDNPLWAPDGRTLLYLGAVEGRVAIYAGSPQDQGNTVRVIYTAPADVLRVRLHSASRVRKCVLFSATTADTTGYFQLDPEGTSAPEPIARAGGGFLQLSPDGRWLALTGHRTGRSEVYVRRYPDGPEIQVTADGGEEARWSPRGDELYYRYGDVWYVVRLSLEPAAAIGYPRELFRGPYANINGFSHAHDPNTDRFLVLLPARVQEPQPRLQVVVNWGAEVKRRLAGSPPVP